MPSTESAEYGWLFVNSRCRESENQKEIILHEQKRPAGVGCMGALPDSSSVLKGSSERCLNRATEQRSNPETA